MNRAKGIPIERVWTKLARLWLIGSGIVFLIVVLQSVLGKYGNHADEVWAWFVPTTVPTVSLIVGVMGARAVGTQDRRTVKSTFVSLAWWLSLVYLIVLLLTIVLEPYSPFESLDLLKMSNYWLSPLQGLAIATIGHVFTSK